jgi:formylglycine-generating enzyme required for sulfatase activity
MIKSINKYKGFYIGRYETGDDVSHSSSKNCFINPKVVRYNSNINYITWYDSYKALQRLSGKTQKYVETGMIYDTMWDYTLKWLQETDTRSYEEISEDSGTWGNYNNNTKTTQSGGTTPARTGAIETIEYKGETYIDSPTASNNIFDIAGNVLEWTRSRNDTNRRRFRGGYCNNGSSDYPARYVGSDLPSVSSNRNIGVRGQLYIL